MGYSRTMCIGNLNVAVWYRLMATRVANYSPAVLLEVLPKGFEALISHVLIPKEVDARISAPWGAFRTPHTAPSALCRTMHHCLFTNSRTHHPSPLSRRLKLLWRYNSTEILIPKNVQH